MELAFNENPRFTKWLASSGALHEQFVVIDVGVLGGENPRWRFFGDHLIVHGFDAIREVINELSQSNANSPNKTFHGYAIGNEDGERTFFFKPRNPTNSSFYDAPNPHVEARTVPIRRLDTLLKDKTFRKPTSSKSMSRASSGTCSGAQASCSLPAYWALRARPTSTSARFIPTRISP